MSLINDALRKARQQATDQDARSGGSARPSAGTSRDAARSMMPSREVTGVGLGVVLGLVLGLGIGLGAVVMRFLAPSTSAQEALVSAVDGQPLAPGEAEAGHGQGAAAFTAPIETPRTAAVPAIPPTPVSISEPTPPPTPLRTPLPTPIPTPRPTPTPRIDRTESGLPLFVLDAALDDGVRLQLGYIILTSSWSVANINGRDMHPGQIIDGWTVDRIAKDEVELFGPGDARIVIRTR